jgi:hypothetical protein
MKRAIFALAFLLVASAQAAEEPHGFRWSCKPTGKNSMQCTVQNNSDRDAGVCVEVVKVCKDGDHVAELCSGPMRPGETRARVVREFQPKVKLFESCQGTEYRDPIIR